MTERLRIATYNVHGYRGQNGVYAPEKTAHALLTLEADLLGIQEAMGWPDLEKHMPFHWHTIWAPSCHIGDQILGNLLISRWPIVHSRVIDLSFAGREPRSAIDAVIEISSAGVNTSWRVITTHFGLLRWERREQANQLRESIEHDQTLPLILMGDFNEWRRSGPIVRVFDEFLGTGQARPTFPARLPILALDRIWVRPSASLATLKVPKGGEYSRVSDHLPVIAEIDLT